MSKRSIDAPADGGAKARGHQDDANHSESTILLVDRARAGDSNAMLVLLERTAGSLRRWAKGRLPVFARGGADTEDVVQDVVMRALINIKRFEHRTVGALQSYLRESVRNRITDEVRQAMRRGVTQPLPDDLAEDAHSPIEELILRERSERYLQALHKLKPADRIAIIYRLEHRYGFAEIARRLGKGSPDAARVAVSRAIKRLAAELDSTAALPLRRSTASGAAGRGAGGRAKKDAG